MSIRNVFKAYIALTSVFFTIGQMPCGVMTKNTLTVCQKDLFYFDMETHVTLVK